MFAMLLGAVLVNILPYVTHSWASSVDDTTSASNEDSWLGWGANSYNNRWASSFATVDSSNVADLHPICQQAYTPGVSAAPLVVDGIAYYVTWSGTFIALEYTSCSVLWQTNVTDIILSYQPVDATFIPIVRLLSRTTPVMENNILFIGTQANALLLAIDKTDGNLIDKVQISKHPLAVITQSPTIWQGSLFVGSSSMEELGSDRIPGYVCCSFIAAMNAFTLEHDRFKLLWSHDMIPFGSNFTGAAIWGSQPSIDPTRNQVFIATGNIYSTPPQYTDCLNKTANSSNSSNSNTTDSCVPQGVYQESVLAFDASTGQINWSRELSPLDAWTVACLGNSVGNPSNCPPSPGPDADFGMAPSFVSASEYTPSGEDILVVGQKNGNLYAMGAQTGKLLWARTTSPDGIEGGLIWGIAVDANAVYYTAGNSGRALWQLQNGTSLSNSAFGALNLTTGTILWETPVPANDTTLVMPTIVKDIVLVGSSGAYSPSGESQTGPGSLIALEKLTGLILKSWVLDSYFHDSVAVVGDLVMFGTGYATSGGSFNVWKIDEANLTGSY